MANPWLRLLALHEMASAFGVTLSPVLEARAREEAGALGALARAGATPLPVRVASAGPARQAGPADLGAAGPGVVAFRRPGAGR